MGIDNGLLCGEGSAQFSVENPDGVTVVETKVLRCGDGPITLEADITGLDSFDIVVKDGGDSPRYDVSDLAEARVIMADGTIVYLDEVSWSYQ